MYISFYLAVQWGMKLHLTIHLLGPLNISLHGTGTRCAVPACSCFCFGYYCKYPGKAAFRFLPGSAGRLCSLIFTPISTLALVLREPQALLQRETSGRSDLGGALSVQPSHCLKGSGSWFVLKFVKSWKVLIWFPPSVCAVSCFCCFGNAESKLS